jgi:hypothetical protein
MKNVTMCLRFSMGNTLTHALSIAMIKFCGGFVVFSQQHAPIVTQDSDFGQFRDFEDL